MKPLHLQDLTTYNHKQQHWCSYKYYIAWKKPGKKEQYHIVSYNVQKLEEEMATHFHILAWNPIDREPGGYSP